MKISSYAQELKIILRRLSLGEDAGWEVPQRPADTVYLKETLGPFTEIESRFNPLEVLLHAGFPPAKLQILIIGRAPLSTWSSWKEWWGERTAVERFILAYQTTEQIRQQAYEQGIALTTYVYEALRDVDAEVVVRKLFRRLAVPYAPIAVRGWSRLPFGSPRSHVILPKRPAVFVIPGIHDRAKSADGLYYCSREAEILELSVDDVQKIAGAGLAGLYEDWRRACGQDLDITISPDDDWERYGRCARA